MLQPRVKPEQEVFFTLWSLVTAAGLLFSEGTITSFCSNCLFLILKRNSAHFPSEIFFETATDKLVIQARKELKNIAKSLIDISKIIPREIDWVLRIDGHTDKRPISNSDFANYNISNF